MSDDDSLVWLLVGCAVGDPSKRLRPRDKWDVVVYVATVLILAVLAIVFA